MNEYEVSSLIDACLDGEPVSEEGPSGKAARDEKDIEQKIREAGKEEELLLARGIRDSMRGMRRDVPVPLGAQAAWRQAVRKEAAKRNRWKKAERWAAAAAALVLMTGTTLGILKKEGKLWPAQKTTDAVVVMESAGTEEAANDQQSVDMGVAMSAVSGSRSETSVDAETASANGTEDASGTSAFTLFASTGNAKERKPLSTWSKVCSMGMTASSHVMTNVTDTDTVYVTVPGGETSEVLESVGDAGGSVMSYTLDEDAADREIVAMVPAAEVDEFLTGIGGAADQAQPNDSDAAGADEDGMMSVVIRIGDDTAAEDTTDRK